MLNKLKILVIATAVAGSASSAFAATTHHHGHRAQQIERYAGPQLFEGRNNAWSYPTGGTFTGRDALVQELGN
jgi:hypothetical protein